MNQKQPLVQRLRWSLDGPDRYPLVKAADLALLLKVVETAQDWREKRGVPGGLSEVVNAAFALEAALAALEASDV